jgi:hypothetical protein
MVDSNSVVYIIEISNDYLANDSNYSFFENLINIQKKKQNILDIIGTQYNCPKDVIDIIKYYMKLCSAICHAYRYRLTNALICSMRMYHSYYIDQLCVFRHLIYNANSVILSDNHPILFEDMVDLHSRFKICQNNQDYLNINYMSQNQTVTVNDKKSQKTYYECHDLIYKTHIENIQLFECTINELSNDCNFRYFNLLYTQRIAITLILQRLIGETKGKQHVNLMMQHSKITQHAIKFRGVNAEICSMRMCCVSDHQINIKYYGLRHKIIENNQNILSNKIKNCPLMYCNFPRLNLHHEIWENSN